MSPPSMRTVAVPGASNPDRTAAAAAAHAEVPDDSVGPTPRSQIRIAISRRARAGRSANCTLVPRGKASAPPINAP